jgi:hypothetical protein
VRERTMEDLRGLIDELVAVDENGKDQLSALEPAEVLKLKTIFAHAQLDLTDIASKVSNSATPLEACTGRVLRM